MDRRKFLRNIALASGALALAPTVVAKIKEYSTTVCLTDKAFNGITMSPEDILKYYRETGVLAYDGKRVKMAVFDEAGCCRRVGSFNNKRWQINKETIL